MRLNFDSWFKRRILHVPNWIEIKLNKLCLLECEVKTRHSRSAILFGKTMRRLNQISRTYSFESTKISIWFGARKMRRLNQAYISSSVFRLQIVAVTAKNTSFDGDLTIVVEKQVLAYNFKRTFCYVAGVESS